MPIRATKGRGETPNKVECCRVEYYLGELESEVDARGPYIYRPECQFAEQLQSKGQTSVNLHFLWQPLYEYITRPYSTNCSLPGL